MNNVATLDPVDELRAQVRGAVVRETDFNAMQPSSAESRALGRIVY